MNILKRVLTIALCSILLVCTIPQFSIKSHAVAETYATFQIMTYLTSYLGVRGYSIVKDEAGSYASLQDWKNAKTEDLADFLFGVFDRLNAFGATYNEPGLGDEFRKALALAALTGSIVLSERYATLIDEYFSQSTAENVLVLGTSKASIQTYKYDAGYTYTWWELYGGNRSLTFEIDTIPLCRFVSQDRNNSVLFVPADLSDYTLNTATSVPEYDFSYVGNYSSRQSVTIDGYKYYAYEGHYKNSSSIPTYQFYSIPVVNDWPSLQEILRSYITGTYDEVETGSLFVSRLFDTSSTDVLTSTSEIETDTGDVSGPVTIYLPSQDVLETAVDQFNDSTISYEDFLKALGLASVASDASVADKESAASTVAYPDATYDWFTRTRWGESAISDTTEDVANSHAEESSIAESISDTLKGGNNSEDDNDKNRGKGLLAALLIGLGIWSTPIITGDNPSPGGIDPDGSGSGSGGDDGSGDTSGYLQESIAGMTVASGFIGDLFASAGGSNGFGLIYTVGASFVVFSVLIGAANYFGALFHGNDTKQNIKSSGKSSRSSSGNPKKKGS